MVNRVKYVELGLLLYHQILVRSVRRMIGVRRKKVLAGSITISLIHGGGSSFPKMQCIFLYDGVVNEAAN